MFCIRCHHNSTRVTNSRPHKKQASIWRRRKCSACGALFTTIETVASDGQLTIEKNGTQHAFSVPTLMISLHSSLSTQKTAPEDAYWLAQTILEQLMTQHPGTTVTPLTVAQTAYDVLDRFDAAAALRYGLDHGLIQTKKSRRRR